MASYDLATRTLYVAHEPHVIEMALGIAAGAWPDIGFIALHDRCWWQLAFLSIPTIKPVTIGMQWPAHDQLLLAIARRRSFVFQAEGCIPVEVNVNEALSTLKGWLETKGWKV